ncbi:MAG: hypothetical protein HQK65_12830 [Desulfamplus sp.]|nr:hypothetical protein [Desulfamplus sp.]
MHERAALEKYEKDDSVNRVIILPSFKTKTTTFNSNVSVQRCDDVVIEADSIHPAQFEYQIGCGFLVLKLDIAYQVEVMALLQQAISHAIAELPVLRFPTPQKIFSRVFNTRIPVSSELPESIAPDNWLPLISSGIQGYLTAKEDPCKFLPFLNRFVSGTTDVSINNDLPETVFSQDWLHGHAAKPNDDAMLSMTGSHYLDVHFVREVIDDAHSSLRGKLILHIHACGANIPAVLSRGGLLATNIQCISKSVMFKIINLMHNFATINRAAIAMRFIRHLRDVIGNFGVEPIIDQAHHDVFASNGKVYFYNDSQRLTKERIAILPAGYPLADSYLVKPGDRSDSVLNGLSHNLKIPIKNGKASHSGKGKVLLVETFGMSNRWQLLSRRISVDQIKKEHRITLGAQQIIEKMCKKDILKPVAILQPLLRFHNRRNEPPFHRIGLTK